jgi:hypothetical protein
MEVVHFIVSNFFEQTNVLVQNVIVVFIYTYVAAKRLGEFGASGFAVGGL